MDAVKGQLVREWQINDNIGTWQNAMKSENVLDL